MPETFEPYEPAVSRQVAGELAGKLASHFVEAIRAELSPKDPAATAVMTLGFAVNRVLATMPSGWEAREPLIDMIKAAITR